MLTLFYIEMILRESVDVTSVTDTTANSDDEDEEETDSNIDSSSDSGGFMKLIDDDYL